MRKICTQNSHVKTIRDGEGSNVNFQLDQRNTVKLGNTDRFGKINSNYEGLNDMY